MTASFLCLLFFLLKTQTIKQTRFIIHLPITCSFTGGSELDALNECTYAALC